VREECRCPAGLAASVSRDLDDLVDWLVGRVEPLTPPDRYFAVDPARVVNAEAGRIPFLDLRIRDRRRRQAPSTFYFGVTELIPVEQAV
jgi:hypothetical protein